MILYRICKARYAASAFSGTGGLKVSGRWHHKGRPVVYASGTLSLAALEYLVHLGRRDAKISLVSVQATVPDDLPIETIDVSALPRNWVDSPPAAATMALGTAWLAEARTPGMRVPSAVIPGEFNFLLNPQHSEFKRVAVSGATRFLLDHRLLK